MLKSVTTGSIGEQLLIRGSITCTTKNLLYIGNCAKGDRTCLGNPQYWGETGQSAEQRFCWHRNSVVQAFQEHISLSVGEHFRSVGHSVSDFVLTPVEKIMSNNIYVRKVKLIINKYNLINNGLDKRL